MRLIASVLLITATVAIVLAGSPATQSSAAPRPAPMTGHDPAVNAGTFLETFDGSPAGPTPWHSANWDVTVHSRDLATLSTLEPMAAMHGSDCGAPPATHTISTYADAVFQCRDHVMTAIKAEGYGVIYLTPNALADFSVGEAVVKFDVSTLRTSDRDWIDLWLTPFNDNVQLVGDVGAVDLNGNPRNGVHIRMDQFNGGTIFRGSVIRNFVDELVGSNDGLSLEQLLTPSAVTRTSFELRVSRTHLKFGIPSLNAWWVDTTFADLGWTSGVLQLGHHSYNPEKADGCGPPQGQAVCRADTWHWDNVSIAPATPFTILQPDRSFSDATTGPQLSFPAAPANAHLRFTAIGKSPEVSFNGGATWQAAQPQAYEQQLGEEHFSSYWTPIPTGTQRVQFRATDWFAGSWLVRSASIWSADGTAGAPVATPPPAATGFRGAWRDQSAYPVIVPGSVATVTMRFQNTGSETWQAGTPGRQVNLGIAGDSLAFAALGMAVGWLGPNRLATTEEPSVAPGETGTFRFDIRAPAAPGAYRIDVRLVNDGVAWLDDQGVYLVVTGDYGFHSGWLSQTPWPALRTGETTTVALSFRNTGSRTWRQGVVGQQVTLGIVGDDTSWRGSAVSWPSANRPAIQSEAVVLPGDTATFAFQIRAPADTGVRDLQLRLVVDGVTWLDDQGTFVRVTVRP